MMTLTRQRALTLACVSVLLLLVFLTVRSPGSNYQGVLISYRSLFGFPDSKFLYPYTEKNCQPPAEVKLEALDPQDLCPRPILNHQHGLTITRRPTFILRPATEHPEAWDATNRTTFMPDQPQSNLHDEVRDRDEPHLSRIGFMAWAPRKNDIPRQFPRKFRTGMAPEERCPVFDVPAYVEPDFVQAEDLKTYLPSLGQSPSGCRPVATQKLGCMFGFATTPSRAIKYLPRWNDWLNNTKTIEISSIVILQAPNETDVDKNWEVEMIGKALNLPIRIMAVPAKRYELRYMKLVKHMWLEAMKRESEGQHRTDWFIIADDDTYFLSLDSMNRILGKYNPLDPHLVGASSESQQANNHFGRIAFGGAGIFLSRGLMAKMNAPKAFESCLEVFGHDFGGDSMVTKCALKLTTNATFKAEATLHQLDIRDEGHGIFQAGLRFTTIHHWDSWFQLQPRAHPHTLKSNLALARLLGQAARVVGAENWTRRYVWGFAGTAAPEGVAAAGAVVVSLGYSITIFADNLLRQASLSQVEHTFAAENLVLKTRPALLETRQRRTYYLKAVRLIDGSNNRAAVLTHVNQEGELVDLVWDARPRPPSST